MERKLASVQKIVDVAPIENADAIERVTVLGWQCVAQKGEFEPGDRVVYCEVDSFLPIRPEFEFLRKSCYRKFSNGEEGFRIKTVRLRGQISQGIVFPLSILSGLRFKDDTRENPVDDFKEGMDVTGPMGVVKYEPITSLTSSGEAFGLRPVFVPKTDEMRIQSIPELLRELEGLELYITTKADGMSCSLFWNSNHERPFGICGRNYELRPGDDGYSKAAEKYDLENRLKAYGKNIILQGEVVGPGIQKNRLNVKDVDFLLFDVVFIDEQGRYADLEELQAVAKDLGLKTVEVCQKEIRFDSLTIDGLLEMAKGKYTGTNNNREGIVIRPCKVKYSEVLGGRLSCKVVNNEYLLKEEE